MSEKLNLTVGGIANEGFTIKSMCGCRVVFGSIPITEIGMLTHGFSKKAVMALDLANRLDATFVIGEPKDIEELRKAELPVCEERNLDYKNALGLGLPDVALWLRNAEHGSSAKSMCKRFFGLPARAKGDSHPKDPDDLRRCINFLDATKAHDKVTLMEDVSPVWKRLVGDWGIIVATFKSEIVSGTSAPKTYALLQKAINLHTQ